MKTNPFKAGDKVVCVDPSRDLAMDNEYTITSILTPELVYLSGFDLAWDVRRFKLVATSEAKKQTDGKEPLDVLFRFPGLADVATIFGYGESKYPSIDGDFNFRKGKGDRAYKMKLIGAALRHVFAWVNGESFDKESGRPHLAHAVCNLLMVADIDIQEKK